MSRTAPELKEGETAPLGGNVAARRSGRMGASGARKSHSSKAALDKLAKRGVSVGLKFKKGDLVVLSGNRVGEIKYKGLIKGQKGQWYGCELFSTFGDTDGKWKGKKNMQYFKCGPKRGVFVKRRDLVEHCVDKGGRTQTIIWYTTNYGRVGADEDDINNDMINTGMEDEEDPNDKKKRLAWEALHYAMSYKAALDTEIVNARANLANYLIMINSIKDKRAEIEAKLATKDGEIEKNLARIKQLRDYFEEQKAIVEAAKQEVRQITKDEIVEIRSYKDPPDMIYTVLICVLILQGTPENDCGRISRILSERNFLADITGFNSEKITRKQHDQVDKIWREANPTYEAVQLASRACGILFQWVEAQVSFSGLLLTRAQWEAEIKQYRKNIRNIEKSKIALQQALKRNAFELEKMMKLYDECERTLIETQKKLTDAGFKVDDINSATSSDPIALKLREAGYVQKIVDVQE